MSKRLEDNFDFLRVLAKCNKKQRRALIEHGNNELIKCVYEVALNVLKGGVKLNDLECY